jgi:2'-5' RNA ligase
LTFAYFGNISLSDTQPLKVAMRQVAREVRPFDVRVEGVGTYPNPREVVALWAGVGAPGNSLQAVSTAVHDAVKGYGWALDRRIFRPQILLGRNSTPEDARAFIDQMTDYTGPAWTFDTLVVLHSRPVGDGAVAYDIFDIYPLTPPA